MQLVLKDLRLGEGYLSGTRLRHSKDSMPALALSEREVDVLVRARRQKKSARNSNQSKKSQKMLWFGRTPNYVDMSLGYSSYVCVHD